MKALKPEQYAALLEQYIAHLDGELAAIAAFAPSDIAPGGLRDSYVKAAVSAALSELWGRSMRELAWQHFQAQQAARWEQEKVQHLYV